MALSDNLQGWWCPSLDTAGNGTTTLTDLSGNGNNGTLTNMDAGTDWVADTNNGGVRALDFAAGSEYVRINNVGQTGTNLATSLSMWVYFRSLSLSGVALWSQLRGPNEGWYVTFDSASGNKFLFTDGVNVSNNIGISGAQVPTLNQWSHVAFCVDSNKNWVYYLNGAAVKSGTFIADIFRQVSTIHFGRRTNTVDALIDGTALYSRQITADEVSQLYNGGRSLNLTNLSTGLQGWWCPSLDTAGNGTTTLTDLSGNGNNGTLTNMDAATDWVADTDNGGVRALDFDGQNDFVNFGDVFDLGDGELISISAWVYCGLTPPAANASIVCKQNSSAPFNGYNLFYNSSANEFRFQIAESISSSYLQVGFGSWGTGWCHLAVTYDGSEDVSGIACYINGVLQSVGNTANNLSGSPSTTTPLQIGGRDSTIWFFPDLIDAVAIAARAWTADEVTQLYNGGRSLNLLATGTTQSIVPQLNTNNLSIGYDPLNGNFIL